MPVTTLTPTVAQAHPSTPSGTYDHFPTPAPSADPTGDHAFDTVPHSADTASGANSKEERSPPGAVESALSFGYWALGLGLLAFGLCLCYRTM